METLRKFFRKIAMPTVEYEPLIEARIFKDAILHNLNEFKKQYPNLQFAPVIKSNAYGHGLIEVARILEDEQNTLSVPQMHSGHLPQRGRREHVMPFFVVDSFYEALLLRRAGIKSKILMLGYNRIEQLVNPKLKNCAATIIDFSTLVEVTHKLNRPMVFHLKIDTGMHRQGLWGEEVNKAIVLIKSNSNFILEGLCSHLADADGENDVFTKKQIALWRQTAELFKKNFSSIKYFHLSATAGTYFSKNIQANVGRLGLGLYGINVSPFEKLNLKPALEMVSVISSIKTIHAGEKIGYNITWQANRETKVATVPVGYNEGVDRRLSNKGFYKVNGKLCPIIGRVSMNISSIDVTDAGDVKVGDEVVVFSKNCNDKNSIENVAKLCQTIPYEILVHIPEHLRRIII
jgi:alanine racemase